jgi:transposase InsO family protein
LADHGVICSMSRSGNIWDNAAMESFFSSLKRTARKLYRTRDEAKVRHPLGRRSTSFQRLWTSALTEFSLRSSFYFARV